MEVVYNKSITEDTQEVILAVGLDENGVPVRPQFLSTSNPGGTCQIAPTVVVTEKSYQGDNTTVLEFFSRSPEDEDYGLFYDKEHDKLTPLMAQLHPQFVEMTKHLELTDTGTAFFDWLWYALSNVGARVIERDDAADYTTVLEVVGSIITQMTETLKTPTADGVLEAVGVQVSKGNTPTLIWETRCLFPVDGKMCAVHPEQPPAELAQPGIAGISGKLETQICTIDLTLPLKAGDVFYTGEISVGVDETDKQVSSIAVRLTPFVYQPVSEELEGDDDVLLEESPNAPE